MWHDRHLCLRKLWLVGWNWHSANWWWAGESLVVRAEVLLHSLVNHVVFSIFRGLGGRRKGADEYWCYNLNGQKWFLKTSLQMLTEVHYRTKTELGLPWWLRFCASNARGQGSIPGQGTKSPSVTQLTKYIYNNNNRNKMKAGFLKTVTNRKVPLMAVNL